MTQPPIVILGAGIGGLSAAIHLATAGKKVLVFEKNPRVGGKMAEYRWEGFRWDIGPSVITMRPALEELFTSAGRQLSDYVELTPIDPLTRYFYPDGVILDVSRALPDLLEQIHRLDPREVQGYLQYLTYVARLYRILGPVFIFDQPPRLSSLLKISPWDAVHFDGLRTMQRAIERSVHSPHLRQLLGRFATYVGASPYQAPATLNVIAHVELNQGVWYPRGGVYRLAQAYENLAGELGVTIQTDSPVTSIDVMNGKVRGVILANGSFQPATAVLANLDVAVVYRQLLPGNAYPASRLRRLEDAEPSCSGFILLLGVRKKHPGLAHHNIFFSSNYQREFDEIFLQGRPPAEPTIYLSITSKSSPSDAPDGCENWFILVNAPALSPNWDWQSQSEPYSKLVLATLSKHGFDIQDEIIYQRVITPHDIEQMSGAWRGALYGASSNNRWAAFRRPHNRAPDVQGLYFAGGTTHPGGGVPMATLSGRVASQFILQDIH